MAVVSSCGDMVDSFPERAKPLWIQWPLRPGSTLPVRDWRKEGMTSSPHDPYGVGYTRVTMVTTMSSKNESWRESSKRHPSSDCFLQLENMKVESLVIVDQHATVNLYLSLVLPARHAREVVVLGSPEPIPLYGKLSSSRSCMEVDAQAQKKHHNWSEVVTR